ncbi:MAG: RibD family protein [Clostridia bacterium]|nr:RibD family protein [Clostridia bacterium]
MNRPYTICHVLSALDGAIAGSFMGKSECLEALEAYGAIRVNFDCSAILYGTTTMLEFCDGCVGKLSKAKSTGRKDYLSPEAEPPFAVAIDRYGKLAYSKNYLERHGKRQHIIEVLTENVSDEYAAYLRNLGISYIFAGKTDLDCVACMVKLKELFKIDRLMIAGGGYIDWAFADSGMIDELSLVLAPAADGEDRVTVFEKGGKSQNSAIAFTLLDVQKLDGNAVWLRYNFTNAIR